MTFQILCHVLSIQLKKLGNMNAYYYWTEKQSIAFSLF